MGQKQSKNVKQTQPASQLESQPGWKGALCDSEGFYQHYGECGFDTLQFILFFTDGIKEIIQKKIYNGFKKEEIIQNLSIKDYIPNDFILELKKTFGIEKKETIDGILGEITPYSTSLTNIDTLYRYIQTIGKRFLRHYQAETMRLSAPSGDRNPSYKCRAKGINSLLSVSVLQDVMDSSINVYALYYMLNKLLHSFGIKYETILFLNSVTGDLTNIRCILLDLGDVSKKVTGHFGCFYECGGLQYFYENNYGIFKYPWKDLLRVSNESKLYFAQIYVKDISTGKNLVTGELYPILNNKKYIGSEIPIKEDAFIYYTIHINGVSIYFKHNELFTTRNTSITDHSGKYELTIPEKGIVYTSVFLYAVTPVILGPIENIGRNLHPRLARLNKKGNFKGGRRTRSKRSNFRKKN